MNKSVCRRFPTQVVTDPTAETPTCATGESLDTGVVRDSYFMYLSGGLVDISLDSYVGAGNDVWLDVRVRSCHYSLVTR